MSDEKRPDSFIEAVEEHSVEGIEIMMEQSSFLAHGLIYIVMCMVASIVVWSYFGRADIIIRTQGRLEPAGGTTQVYSPANGELVEMYVTEGMPVQKGDLIARLKSASAIQAAGQASKAKMELELAERDRRLFPQKKAVMLREIQTLEEQIKSKEKIYLTNKSEGLRKLSLANKNELERLRIELEQAKNKRNGAKGESDTFKRLYETTGHGGISRVKLMEKQGAYLKAESEYQGKQAQLENLEVKFSGQRTEAGSKIEASYFQLLQLRLQYENKKQEIDTAELQSNNRYRSALAAWEAAARVSLEDLDADNFLKLKAPVSGDVTYVAYRQSGEKVRATSPMVAIAPSDTGKALRIGIPDKDRGLLRVGQPVKLKFAAFPYQRFGFITGKLEYISPSARAPSQGGQQQQGQQQQGQQKGQQQRPFYMGRVSLEKDYFVVNGENIKIRYGMMAVAEVVVQKRRMIDLVLDPFRRLKG